MTQRIVINLDPADAYRRENYGVLLTSQTTHRFTGRGIHNPSFSHCLDVWTNKVHPDPELRSSAKPYRDPHGHSTDQGFSFLWSAQASVISLSPIARAPEGVTLQLGVVVTPLVHGYPLGDFQIRARRGYDPHLVQVDTASSASCQHFIDTGDYLTPEEVAESR